MTNPGVEEPHGKVGDNIDQKPEEIQAGMKVDEKPVEEEKVCSKVRESVFDLGMEKEKFGLEEVKMDLKANETKWEPGAEEATQDLETEEANQDPVVEESKRDLEVSESTRNLEVEESNLDPEAEESELDLEISKLKWALEAEEEQVDPESMMDMHSGETELDPTQILNPRILKALKEKSLDKLSTSQMKLIAGMKLDHQNPAILTCGKYGTGKSHALIIGSLNVVDETNPALQIILVQPTIEAAFCAWQDASLLAKYTNVGISLLNTASALGKKRNENAKVQVLVTTMGKLETSMINNKLFNLDSMKAVIIEDAELQVRERGELKESLTGFFRSLPEKCLRVFSVTDSYCMPVELIPPPRFSIMLGGFVSVFSPTFDFPLITGTETEDEEAGGVFLNLLVGSNASRRALIFCKTRKEIMEMAKFFRHHGIQVATCHGGLKQRSRIRNLQLFQSHACRILITTYMLSRGMFFKDVDLLCHRVSHLDSETFYRCVVRCARIGEERNLNVVSLFQLSYYNLT